jgi:hypothetical protein
MSDFLNDEYWQERYENSQTGWDIGYPSPQIIDYFEKKVHHKSSSILIPGCGNAHEAIALMKLGFSNIHILDFALQPLERLKSKLDNMENCESITLHHQNFFEHKGAYDFIVEQTFFCAIQPNLRLDYAKHVHSLLKDNGILVGLLFNINFSKEGPPFGGNKEEYEEYFNPYFYYLNFDIANLSIPQRQGNELFIELVKKSI